MASGASCLPKAKRKTLEQPRCGTYEMTLQFYLIVGTGFGLSASVAAFLIVYNEYAEHKYSRSRVLKEAITISLVAFAFFLVLSVVAGYALSH
jgi:hypothetical protein